MRVTRSSAAPVVASMKRAAKPTTQSTPSKRVKKQIQVTPPTAAIAEGTPSDGMGEEDIPTFSQDVRTSIAAAEEEGVLLHPALTFKYEDARKHLENVDARWGTLMDRLKCKPFEGEQTAPFEPFRSLASSIIGQQVSWLAARSIQHKFVRIFYPHLPEKLGAPASAAPGAHEADSKDKDCEPESSASPFPTPAQILSLKDAVPTLRAAGLSGRKVEYIWELAERFHDGRLDAKRLWEMTDDEVRETLIQIRGIGIWTVQMFLIFSMKRPDVLPVGDLGIQKNLCKWYSADPSLVPAIHPRKLVVRGRTPEVSESQSSEIPSTPETSCSTAKLVEAYPTPSTPSIADIKAADVHVPSKNAEVPQVSTKEMVFPKTSNNLTPALMKARLNKKIKGNIYLSPTEMEELTAEWAPYRSVACWYLWSITDGDA
ncbi:DNA glycosylase [Meredithblackwellia eburnea MCA 4105]